MLHRLFSLGILTFVLAACALPVKKPNEAPIPEPKAHESATAPVAWQELKSSVGESSNTPKNPEVISSESPPDKPVEQEAQPLSKLTGTIEVFSDFECPYCKRFESEGLAPLRAKHPNVQIILRHFPLGMHQYAVPAAEYAICAEAQGKGDQMAAALFSTTDLTAKNLAALAQNLELQTAQLQTCLDAPETAARIAADRQRGASLSVEGTPTFFINGAKYEGSYPVENLEKILREAAE